MEQEAQGLRIVEKLRATEGWYECSESSGAVVWAALMPPGPYQRYDPNKIHNSLTAGSLRGPGKLAIPPILFAKHDESEAIGMSRRSIMGCC